MARQFTAAQLITEVRDQGEFEDTDFISDSVMLRWISNAYAHLHGILTDTWEDYYVTEATASMVSGEDDYTLPETFKKMLAVDVSIGGKWIEVPKYNYSQRNTRQDGGETYRYRIQSGNIKFIPTPDSAYTFRLTFVPIPSKITAMSDTIDGVNGWEEYIILRCLEKAYRREGSLDHVADVRRRIAEILEQIEKEAAGRDAAEPDSISDYDCFLPSSALYPVDPWR